MTEANNTRDQIITFATELFLTKGFKSVTMDDLASDMAMSKKTIYTYFKTKKDLIHASANHIFQSIADGIEVICNLALNPIEELFTINDFVFKHLKNESSSPEYQLLKYYPKVHASLQKRKFDIVHNCMVESIERGKQIKIFRQEVDAEIIARFYFFSIAQIRDKELFPEDQFRTYDVIHSYLDYHVRGIATVEGIHFLENEIYNKENQ